MSVESKSFITVSLLTPILLVRVGSRSIASGRRLTSYHMVVPVRFFSASNTLGIVIPIACIIIVIMITVLMIAVIITRII